MHTLDWLVKWVEELQLVCVVAHRAGAFQKVVFCVLPFCFFAMLRSVGRSRFQVAETGTAYFSQPAPYQL